MVIFTCEFSIKSQLFIFIHFYNKTLREIIMKAHTHYKINRMFFLFKGEDSLGLDVQCIPIMPVFRRQRQENAKSKPILHRETVRERDRGRDRQAELNNVSVLV